MRAEREGHVRQRSSIGATVIMPSNLLSNRLLELEPGVSLYYLPERDSLSVQVSLSLGGF